MNKIEFVDTIAKKAGITKEDAEAAYKAFVAVVTETLAKGERIQLVGFGNFEVSNRAARKGRNPKTKQAIDIPACRMPKFKPGKVLKNIVNE